MSASCNKCVKVLRDLISGLQEEPMQHPQQQQGRRRQQQQQQTDEPPPLTLLRAIAGSTSNGKKQQPRLKVEDVEDGVRLTIPVETTLPTLLRRWTKLPKLVVANENDDNNDDDEFEEDLMQPLYHTMATSVNPAEELETSSIQKRNDNDDGIKESTNNQPIADPLTIELKCRKCSSSGPEGGARAFLMGPQPLSVVLCHNRIAATRPEVEEILTHELIHLFDVQTMQLDLQDCENLAYSEVRAAKAAECRDSWKQLQPYCVKQKAIAATNNLYPNEGRQCIQRVFRTAFADNRPFHREDDNTSHYRPYTSTTTTDYDDDNNNQQAYQSTSTSRGHIKDNIRHTGQDSGTSHGRS
eukprot:CAMPEP_0178801376 /NCGR_PEP_ID=MMETSP0745-20121128/13316_1 /TAXON_ID=913974 /ORGANISM="Nitzschia punctata, Strain CCMP561" /LENGTH=354 /DNA_ID=CAMNT_0020460211 /DNA_START=33 /DNA_END=1094 /DNA_ORIENTATION=+